MRNFIIGFIVGALVLGGAAAWLILKIEKAPIFYPPPQFYDDKDDRPDSGYMIASGTLTGEDMSGRTYVKVTCWRPDGECRVLELSQADSPKMVMEWQDQWKIVSWNAETVKAASQPMEGACNRVEFTFYRVNQEAVYTRVPNPGANRETCKQISRKTFSWKLGEQPIG